MISLNELKGYSESKRLVRPLLFAFLIWIAALAVFFLVLEAYARNKELQTDAGKVLYCVQMIKSSASVVPARNVNEPLAQVSQILEKLNLREKVKTMSSSSGGIVVQINRIYADDFTKLAEDIERNGLSVKTAEIRAITSQKDGRLLDVLITLSDGDTK